jgi:butyrate kinase
MKEKILIMNFGSTSTKVAVYHGNQRIFSESIQHPADELKAFACVFDQKEYRKAAILQKLAEKEISLDSIDIISCRGSNIRPVPSGIYFVDEQMVQDMKSGNYGMHANNIGGVIAFELSQELNIPVITVDPPKTDEFEKNARYSGLAEIERRSSFHALNQKSTARKVAADLEKKYEELNLIVAHLGGGISIGAHKKGPFSPERTGALPVGSLIRLCYSGTYTQAQMLRMVSGKGGLMSYLDTNSGLEVEARIKAGDQEALAVLEAMAYQISKEIGSMAAVLCGKVDAITLTGSLAYWDRLVDLIKERVSYIAPILIKPGENEIEALAEGALRYLSKEEPARRYAESVLR